MRARARRDLPSVLVNQLRFPTDEALHTTSSTPAEQSLKPPEDRKDESYLLLGPISFLQKLKLPENRFGKHQESLTLSGARRTDISVVVDLSTYDVAAARPEGVAKGVGGMELEATVEKKVATGDPRNREKKYLTTVEFRRLIDVIADILDACAPYYKIVHPQKAYLMITKRMMKYTLGRVLTYQAFREVYESLRRFHPSWRRSHADLLQISSSGFFESIPLVGGSGGKPMKVVDEPASKQKLHGVSTGEAVAKPSSDEPPFGGSTTSAAKSASSSAPAFAGPQEKTGTSSAQHPSAANKVLLGSTSSTATASSSVPPVAALLGTTSGTGSSSSTTPASPRSRGVVTDVTASALEPVAGQLRDFGRLGDEVRALRNLVIPLGETQPMLDALRNLCATYAAGGDHAAGGVDNHREVDRRKKAASSRSTASTGTAAPATYQPRADVRKLREKMRLKKLRSARTVFVWNFKPERDGGLPENGWRRLLQQAGVIHRLSFNPMQSFLHCEYLQRPDAEMALHLFQNKVVSCAATATMQSLNQLHQIKAKSSSSRTATSGKTSTAVQRDQVESVGQQLQSLQRTTSSDSLATAGTTATAATVGSQRIMSATSSSHYTRPLPPRGLKMILLESQGALEEIWVREIQQILHDKGELRNVKLRNVKTFLEKKVQMPLDYRAAGFGNIEECLLSVPGVYMECVGPRTYFGRKALVLKFVKGGKAGVADEKKKQLLERKKERDNKKKSVEKGTKMAAAAAARANDANAVAGADHVEPAASLLGVKIKKRPR
ncbi:unnamed protein product [Amoebophrya sp. A120]|nr:unnamed protein product [Amoebophrya sp. A120]|eukprot:GSA120T00020077001.1